MVMALAMARYYLNHHKSTELITRSRPLGGYRMLIHKGCTMIPIEEWLQDAQALPVGRSERVYHGAEHRQNMLVKNKPEGGCADE